MAWHRLNLTVKQGLFGGDLAVSLNIMNANRVVEIWSLHATYCLEVREMKALLTGFTKDRNLVMKVCSKRLCINMLTLFHYSNHSLAYFMHYSIVRICGIYAHFRLYYVHTLHCHCCCLFSQELTLSWQPLS